jgi:DNA modification methylase
MQTAFKHIPMKDDGQVLINVGQVIRDGEIVQYEQPFIQWMRANGWKLFDRYVWNKGFGKPFVSARLVRQHEEILHFNKNKKKPNKTVEKKPENIISRKGRMYNSRWPDGRIRQQLAVNDASLATHKQHGSVFTVNAVGGSDRGRRKVHPAVFPTELCERIIPIWSNAGEVLYEPFCGSGTMIIAAENLGRRCFAMDIEPEYVELALSVWEQRSGICGVLM